MTEAVLLNAVNMALAHAMEEDDQVLVMGEDVGPVGGVFRATDGLFDRFGRRRVLDMPLAESVIVGAAVGLSTQGFKPVAEIQFMGFLHPVMDQLINHAARMRNRTRGRLTCPLVVRAPFGGGIHAPEHHSESLEAWFAHAPGLRVVIPSSPANAYGLLLAAIRNSDPVLFLEPKRIYRLGKEEIVDNGEALPLDKCFTLREGSDITLVSWGAMITETLAAADALAEEGVAAEVIDVATISPLDMDTIMASVERTGRCVIVHEAAQTGGFGGEIAARLAEHGLLSLIAPVIRVTGYDTIMPLYRLEKNYMPSTGRILEGCQKALAYS